MTEDEAKQKWCPMVRSISVDLEDKDSSNMLHGAADPFEHSRCIGSGCMMWRQTCHPAFDENNEPKTHPNGALVLEPHGYCGLAGKP